MYTMPVAIVDNIDNRNDLIVYLSFQNLIDSLQYDNQL